MKTNLNAGTLSPTPEPVLAAVTRLRRMQADQPSDFLWRQTPVLLKRSRAALAKFLRVKPDDLALLPNVTHAINLAVTSLRLPRGSEILTTDHEYGAMLYCWQRWAKERGWKLRKIKLPYTTEDPSEILAAFKNAIRPATRVLFFSHVTSPIWFELLTKQVFSERPRIHLRRKWRRIPMLFRTGQHWTTWKNSPLNRHRPQRSPTS